MIMKRFIITTLSILLGLTAGAQDVQWMNITALNYAATGGADNLNTLKQYILLREDSLSEDSPLYRDLKTFTEEFMQMQVNAATPGNLNQFDENIAAIRQMMKDHPEMADQLKEALKEAESARAEIAGYANPDMKSLSVDPVKILKEMKALAVNKKAYSAWRDLGGERYAVTEAPVYGSVFEGDGRKDIIPDESRYSWGVIDTAGKQIIEQKYDRIFDFWAEYDIIFLSCLDKKGNVCAGAAGYDGRIRIPFDYDGVSSWNLDSHVAAMYKSEKVGMVSFDGKVLQPCVYVWTYPQGEWLVRKEENGPLGVVGPDGSLVIPLKYEDYWSCEGGELKFSRTDGRLDVYNSETYIFIRTEDKPADPVTQ